MKFLSTLIFAGVLLAATAYAQDTLTTAAPKTETIHGYLVDVMCGDGMVKKNNALEKAPQHTTECALSDNCAASGFGVFSGATYIKFDKQGNALAKSLLEKTKTENGVMVNVTGARTGDMLAVSSIKEVHMKAMEKTPSKEKATDMKDMDHMH